MVLYSFLSFASLHICLSPAREIGGLSCTVRLGIGYLYIPVNTSIDFTSLYRYNRYVVFVIRVILVCSFCYTSYTGMWILAY